MFPKQTKKKPQGGGSAVPGDKENGKEPERVAL